MKKFFLLVLVWICSIPILKAEETSPNPLPTLSLTLLNSIESLLRVNNTCGCMVEVRGSDSYSIIIMEYESDGGCGDAEAIDWESGRATVFFARLTPSGGVETGEIQSDGDPNVCFSGRRQR